MAWFFLFIAAVFEIGWPLGMKLASLGQHKIFWLVIAIISMILSGVFLYLAQKNIPIGTAYAIWTGIGASCTFLIGIYFFHDTFNLMRLFGILMIIAGVVLLKVGN